MSLSKENPNLPIANFTPREVVAELDRYVIGQTEAKRAVAVALRNRWRRQRVQGDLRDEITPKNIIMIGPTGVGKTEIARRLAKLAQAPFYKVEATKFTEVGYVGKDAESMIRDLVEMSVNMVRQLEQDKVRIKAEELAEERLLDALLPPKPKRKVELPDAEPAEPIEEPQASREKMRQMLKEGKLNDRRIEIETSGRPSGLMGGMSPGMPMIEIVSAGGSMDDMSSGLRDMLGGLFQGGGKKQRKVRVVEALPLLVQEEAARLIDMEAVTKMAVELAENNGIIFLDEIDKIAGAGRQGGGGGPDVSREGVQRDLLPIIEGTTVSTKYGFVKTNHILFIAAGAFHVSKPSDLIPEMQGRFPVRVELKSLTKQDFLKILTEPRNCLTKQYMALMETDSVALTFAEDGLEEIAALAATLNQQLEDIGARRLHTILERVMDEISFSAGDFSDKHFVVDAAYVRKCLDGIVKDQDLRKFIL
jgi:ATP-dependent HslUV protease ATP-binding subunit HslU